ncbi:MAG: hypothetical protein IIX40_02325, partial [Alistipes sp.]|nr:hypothetical protein [Alistipes sp.]
VELYEKVHALRAKYGANAPQLAAIEAKLAEFRALNSEFNNSSYNWVAFLAEMNKLVNEVAK